MVMCSEPVMRTPARGFSTAYLRRIAIRPGISCSAMEISLRPHAARDRSATLNGTVVGSIRVVVIRVTSAGYYTTEQTIRTRNHDILIYPFFGYNTGMD